MKLVASNRLDFELFACLINETQTSRYEWLRASTVPTALQLACYCKHRKARATTSDASTLSHERHEAARISALVSPFS